MKSTFVHLYDGSLFLKNTVKTIRTFTDGPTAALVRTRMYYPVKSWKHTAA